MRIIVRAGVLAGFIVVVMTGLASAQVHVVVQVPSIRWVVPPPLVTVAPGVRVVEDYDEEVYYDSGWYWYRDGGNWYRSHDHHGNWVAVAAPGVPSRLAGMPPGRYRHYKAEDKADKQAFKRAEKMDKRERKFERHDGNVGRGPGGGGWKGDKGHGKGHGGH